MTPLLLTGIGGFTSLAIDPVRLYRWTMAAVNIDAINAVRARILQPVASI